MNRSSLRIPFLVLAAALLAAFGVSRISFNVDILDVLPKDLPNVQALRLYNEHFNKQRDLVIAVEGDNPADVDRAAEQLARDLIADGIAAHTEWRDELTANPAPLTELVAYLWANSPAETTAALAARLHPESLAAIVAESTERLANAEFSGAEAMRDQYDPYGLLGHPFLAQFLQQAPTGDEYRSDDGRMRLVFADPPPLAGGYHGEAKWLAGLQDYLAAWQQRELATRASLKFGLTGETPYRAGVAILMERDMRNSSLQTSLAIALLFWLIQRRLGRLLHLLLGLALTFSATLAMGALLFGKLSIMSVGFAAILMGLAADYGVLASQYHASFGGDARSLRHRIGPSVAWASLTTATVFLALNLSAFPGIAQLGSLVAIGVIFAALVTLWVQTPLLCASARIAGPQHPEAAPAPRLLRHGIAGTVVALAGALAAIAGCGLPRFDYHLQQISAEKLPPAGVLRHIQDRIPAWGEGNLPVIVAADDEASFLAALDRAGQSIDELKAKGILASAALPAPLWPRPDHQRASAATIAALGAREQELVAAAKIGGYSDEGTGLTAQVCSAWRAMAGQIQRGEPAFPQSAAARALLDRFLARENGNYVLAGSLRAADYQAVKAREFEDLAPINQPGVYLAAWQTLQSSIKPLVQQDLMRVVLPCALLLLVMLGLAFRNFRDFLLALAAMLTSALLLCAWLAITGENWSFQNMAALPVLFGTGIDYSIHVLLALRRYQGDLNKLWQGTGKALLFCGLTTIMGFSTLVAAADPGLASFGKISAAGIFAALAVALLLLPAWWRAWQPSPRHLAPGR